MDEYTALLIIDVQNDFCPGGALPVPDGDRVIAPLNRMALHFAAENLPVLASRDWHPVMTRHFRRFGGAWPDHCIRGTTGAAFHPDLHLPQDTIIFSKGIDPEQDGYSAFEGVSDDGMKLIEVLRTLEIRRIYLGGLATEYCILFTAREALKNGYGITILTDAIAGVDIVPSDTQRALEEMKHAGARLSSVAALLNNIKTAC